MHSILHKTCNRQARRKIVNETSQNSERIGVQKEALMEQKSWLILGPICFRLLDAQNVPDTKKLAIKGCTIGVLRMELLSWT